MNKIKRIEHGMPISLNDFKFIKFSEHIMKERLPVTPQTYREARRARIATELGVYWVAVLPSSEGRIEYVVVELSDTGSGFIESPVAVTYDTALARILISMSMPDLIHTR